MRQAPLGQLFCSGKRLAISQLLDVSQGRFGDEPQLPKKAGHLSAAWRPARTSRAEPRRRTAGHLSAAWRPARTSRGRAAAANGWPSLSRLASRKYEWGDEPQRQKAAHLSAAWRPARTIPGRVAGEGLASSQVLGVPKRRVRAARPDQKSGYHSAAWCPVKTSPCSTAGPIGWPSPISKLLGVPPRPVRAAQPWRTRIDQPTGRVQIEPQWSPIAGDLGVDWLSDTTSPG